MVGLGGEILEEWARKLKRGGYSATVRHQVVKEALCKYEKMCKVEEKEGRPEIGSENGSNLPDNW